MREHASIRDSFPGSHISWIIRKIPASSLAISKEPLIGRRYDSVRTAVQHCTIVQSSLHVRNLIKTLIIVRSGVNKMENIGAGNHDL